MFWDVCPEKLQLLSLLCKGELPYLLAYWRLRKTNEPSEPAIAARLHLQCKWSSYVYSRMKTAHKVLPIDRKLRSQTLTLASTFMQKIAVQSSANEMTKFRKGFDRRPLPASRLSGQLPSDHVRISRAWIVLQNTFNVPRHLENTLVDNMALCVLSGKVTHGLHSISEYMLHRYASRCGAPCIT